VDVDLSGDRRLLLEHRTRPGQLLARKDAETTLRYVAALWGYEVQLQEVDTATDTVLATHTASAPQK
jgi:stage V sporulation protein R